MPRPPLDAVVRQCRRLAPDLLRQFVACRDESAFTTLVHWHAGLVRVVRRAAVLAFALLAAGAGLAFGPPADPEPSRAARARTDRHGDPLPPGARARLGTVRFRPLASEVAFSADGRTLLTCAYGRTLRFFDAATGRPQGVRELPGPASTLAVLSAEGKTLAVRETDGLSLWDTATGRRRHRLAVPDPASVTQAAFAPDGLTLATGEYPVAAVIRLWDTTTGKGRVLGEHEGPVLGLAFSPEGKRLASAGQDRTLRCWDVRRGREVWRIREPATSLAFAPDGRALVSFDLGAREGPRVWDAATGRPARWAKPPAGRRVYSAAFGPRSDTLLLGSGEDILVWDLKAGAVRRRLPGAGWRFKLAPDGKTLVSLTGTLQRWDLATGRPLYPDTRDLGHTESVDAVAYSPDGKRLASAALRDGTVRVWEVSTSRLLHTLPGPHGSGWAFLSYTPDGKHLLAGGGGAPGVSVWDAAGKRVRRWTLSDPATGERLGTPVNWRLTPDGKTLVMITQPPLNNAFGRPSGTLAVWEVATGKLLRRAAAASAVPSSALSPDGRLLAVQGGRLLEAATGQVRQTLQAEHSVGSPFGDGFAFAPNGSLVAGSLLALKRQGLRGWTEAQGVQVWAAASGRPWFRFPVKEFGRFAFAPDVRLLATVGPAEIRLWEVATGKEVWRRPVAHHLLGPYGSPFAFAPDGRTLATGHGDGTVLVWDLAPGPATAPRTAAEREGLWADLAGADAGKAYRAVWTLAAFPEQSLPLLRDHLRPATPLPPERLARLLAGLGSDQYAERRKAARELARLGDRARPALEKALAGRPPLEVRRRVERLLVDLDGPTTRPEELRALRAVWVLEQIRTAEARRLLQALAGGTPGARLTRETKASLDRLGRRTVAMP